MLGKKPALTHPTSKYPKLLDCSPNLLTLTYLLKSKKHGHANVVSVEQEFKTMIDVVINYYISRSGFFWGEKASVRTAYEKKTLLPSSPKG